MRVAAVRALSLLSLFTLAACASPGDAPIKGLQPKLTACTGGQALMPNASFPSPMVFDVTAQVGEDGRLNRMMLQVVKGAAERRAQRRAITTIEQSLVTLQCSGLSVLKVRAHIGPTQAGFTGERVERLP